ncbi:hypothetical protein EJ06DRAFT_88824 [Trichodelitschia bisporula]|uniref:Uncharacterized protein n=1 Tax=Trichodelitschia bisporula TaxID=703511 RepID=A0A6G1HRR7_9PEZI|nr:hypothetical protein EJ06DRAFT_88824 [Trichodelitschia bisporula]
MLPVPPVPPFPARAPTSLSGVVSETPCRWIYAGSKGPVETLRYCSSSSIILHPCLRSRTCEIIDSPRPPAISSSTDFASSHHHHHHHHHHSS